MPAALGQTPHHLSALLRMGLSAVTLALRTVANK